MKYLPEQTPAQHVARREALAKLREGSEFTATWDLICREVLLPVAHTFAAGHRLSDKDYHGLVAQVRRQLTGLGPISLGEASRKPTRTRPKGEEHEFTVLFRSAKDTGDARNTHELVAGRVWLSRRRIEAAYEVNGVCVTRHLMERSIERDLASWTGRLLEVERAILDNLGLVTLWKRAFSTGALSNARLALPFGDGLMLGALEGHPNFGASCILSLSNRIPPFIEREQSWHNRCPELAARGLTLNATSSTVVDGDRLRLEQIDLRDTLVGFVSRYADLLQDVGRGALWADARLTPVPGFDALARPVDQACSELARLLARPRMAEGLNGRGGPLALTEYEPVDASHFSFAPSF